MLSIRISTFVLLILTTQIVGCGKKGTQLKGSLVEAGAPLKLEKSDQVTVTLIPDGPGGTSATLNPGAIVNTSDATFKFMGDAGVSPGSYKIVLKVMPDEKNVDRFDGRFSAAKTPLKYVVAENSPTEEIIIDVKNNTVTRK